MLVGLTNGRGCAGVVESPSHRLQQLGIFRGNEGGIKCT